MFIYDTGKCPRCQSPWTGRLVEKASNAKRLGFMGPIIYTSDKGNCNFGCAECGVMWTAPPKIKWIPVRQYASMCKEWIKTVDTSSPYTSEEEAEISASMYNELMAYDEVPKKHRFSFVRRLFSYEKESLGKQLGGTVSDFAGILGISEDEDTKTNTKEENKNEDHDIWQEH